MKAAVMRSLDPHSTLNQEAIRALKTDLRGPVIQPSDPEYDAARKVWNGMIDKYPALIVCCEGVGDVIQAVQFARVHQLTVAVRSGGHGVAGNAVCDGGMVIDLSLMKGLLIDPIARTARVQAGVNWGELDRAAQPHGLAVPGGKVSDTGISGLTLGGGLGWLRRKYGLTCDSLLSADVVTMDGQLRRANATENPDLYWGLRGGGGGLGIVVVFEFRLHPVGPEMMFVQVFYPSASRQAVLRFFRDFTKDAPDEVSAFVVLGTFPRGSHYPASLWGEPYVMLSACYADAIADEQRIVQALRGVGDPVIDASGVRSYLDIQTLFDQDYPRGSQCYYWKSLTLPALADELVDTLIALAGSAPSALSTIDIWQLGGAVARVGAGDTAFGNRTAPFLLNVEANWADPRESEDNMAWTRGIMNVAQPFSEGGMYLNFPGLFEGGEAAIRAAFQANYSRLQSLRGQYDPNNLLAGMYRHPNATE